MSDPRQLRSALRDLVLAHGVLDDARRPCGAALPFAEAQALMLLRETPGLTVARLTPRLGLDRSNVSRLVKRLVSDGFVQRRASPGDARAAPLSLTARGLALAEHVDRSSAAHFQRVLDTLQASPEAVLTALEALTAALIHTRSTAP